ncbi:hypothetical protein AAG570_012706 [Ranatra chinensis]|uniref:Uncharacterized protein n=1 Tax=Ranatra chinensis TaxID=642074 RepID=A0ABD0YR34_9HEMI
MEGGRSDIDDVIFKHFAHLTPFRPTAYTGPDVPPPSSGLHFCHIFVYSVGGDRIVGIFPLDVIPTDDSAAFGGTKAATHYIHWPTELESVDPTKCGKGAPYHSLLGEHRETTTDTTPLGLLMPFYVREETVGSVAMTPARTHARQFNGMREGILSRRIYESAASLRGSLRLVVPRCQHQNSPQMTPEQRASQRCPLSLVDKEAARGQAEKETKSLYRTAENGELLKTVLNESLTAGGSEVVVLNKVEACCLLP